MNSIRIYLVVLIFISIHLAIPSTAFSQSNIEWGPEMSRKEVKNFWFSHDDALWSLSRENDDFYFYKYENLKNTKKVKDDIDVSYAVGLEFNTSASNGVIDFKVEDFNKILRFITLNEKPYVIVRSGGLLKDVKWSIDIIPFNDGEVERDEAVTILSSKDTIFPGVPRILKRIYIAQSPDNSKLAIGFTNKLAKVWDESNLSVAVLDEDLNLLNKKYYQFPYKINADLSKFDGVANRLINRIDPDVDITLGGVELTSEKNMRLRSFHVSNKGEVITLGKVISDEKVDKAYPYFYSLFKFDFASPSSKPIEKILYDVPNYQEVNVKVYEKDDESLFVWGCYSEGNMYRDGRRSNSYIGTFYEVINSNSFKTLDKNHALIDKEILIASYNKPKKARKKIDKKGIEDYGLNSLRAPKLLDNGDFVSVNKTMYRKEVGEVNGKKKYKLINEGAEVYFMDEYGKVNKRKRLFVRHKCKDKRKAYYGMKSYVNQDGNVYFFYNDHPKNINNTSEKQKKYKGKTKSVLVKATITPDGQVKKRELHNNKSDKRVPWVNGIFYVDGKFYMNSKIDEKYQMGQF